MNPLVSVVVPINNTEKYLIKCVNSIIAQSYKNIEIILVDDGSTDSSPALCEELKRQMNAFQSFTRRMAGFLLREMRALTEQVAIISCL